MAAFIRSKIEDFQPSIPLIQGLNKLGMGGGRYWQMLSERIQMKVQFQTNQTTFSGCLEIGLQNYADEVAQVVELAGKERMIEQVHYKYSICR